MKGEQAECPECGSLFVKKTDSMRFCSVKCRVRYNMREHRKRNPEKSKLEMRKRRARDRGEPFVDARKVMKVCEACGKPFSPRDAYHRHQKYCQRQDCMRERRNAQCRMAYQRNRDVKIARARKYQETVAKPQRRANAAFKQVFREPKICVHCGREFRPQSSRLWWKQRFCGRKECKRTGLVEAQQRHYYRHREELIVKASAGRMNRRAKENGTGGLITV